MGCFDCVSFAGCNDGAPNACTSELSVKLGITGVTGWGRALRYPRVRYSPYRCLSYGARARSRRLRTNADRLPGRCGSRVRRCYRSTAGNGASSVARAFAWAVFCNSRPIGRRGPGPDTGDPAGACNQFAGDVRPFRAPAVSVRPFLPTPAPRAYLGARHLPAAEVEFPEIALATARRLPYAQASR